MKYTVVIRQPVPDEIRSDLEAQIVERFGLNPEQASRLAARRAGRLMKPTSQERANLLLNVFQSAGVQVALEEVPEEGDLLAAPGLGLAPGGSGLGTADGASPFGAPAQNDNDAFASMFTAPASASADPFGAPKTDDALPDWARPAAAVPATPAPKTDDWADFAGGLSVPEVAPAPAPARNETEFLTAVAEEPQHLSGPRSTLGNQLRLGTLLPLGLASLLTLGLLAFSLPRLQNNLLNDNARIMATSVGTNLQSAAEVFTQEPLDSIVQNTNVGFIRIELPDGQSYTRYKDTAKNEAVNKQLAAWAKKSNGQGRVNIGGKNYYVNQATFIPNDTGQPQLVSAVGEGQTLMHRITVGLAADQAANSLRNTLLLVLGVSLLGLLLASLWAARAAQRIVQPLTELVKVADAISLGDLTHPVRASRNDEIGDLAQALERMRLSLQSAMDRLRRRKRS